MNIENLKKAREKVGLTQAQAAEAIGVSDGTYKNYEQGKREPNGDKMVTIANLFNVTTDYLLGREPAQNPFDNLQTVEEMEADLMKRWLELKPESRMVFMQLLRDVVDADNARKAQAAEPKPNNTDYITVSSTLGEIEDRMKADKDANSKDGA